MNPTSFPHPVNALQWHRLAPGWLTKEANIVRHGAVFRCHCVSGTVPWMEQRAFSPTRPMYKPHEWGIPASRPWIRVQCMRACHPRRRIVGGFMLLQSHCCLALSISRRLFRHAQSQVLRLIGFGPAVWNAQRTARTPAVRSTKISVAFFAMSFLQKSSEVFKIHREIPGLLNGPAA